MIKLLYIFRGQCIALSDKLILAVNAKLKAVRQDHNEELKPNVDKQNWRENFIYFPVSRFDALDIFF